MENLGFKMCDVNDKRPLHIAMYPWFALGHLTSFLHLANKFADRHKISFFLPTKTQPKVAHHNHHPHLITFIPVAVPPVDGLPDGAETTNDVPAMARPSLMTAMDLTKDTIDSHLDLLRPHFIFYDFTPWVPGLARKHGVRSVFYGSVYLVTFAYASLQARNLGADHQLTEEELVEPPPDFPTPGFGLPAHEARALARGFKMEFGGGMTLFQRLTTAFNDCDAIGVKSCREMEGVYCDFVEKYFGKPVLLTGPVVPEQAPDSKLEEELDGWLKGFSDSSVIYCALGSECILEEDQFKELVLGLELTGSPFLAALKLPIGCETIESALPEGFVERTKGRGIIHGGWVQQPLILQHPSVGCFITHCGAGSLSEAMVSKCQLVMVPQQMDQFLNAKLMSLELKVGVEVEKREEDGFFTKEAIKKAIGMVMEAESEVGREIKANHAKLREFLLSEGLEKSYISHFIQNLKDLLQ